MVISVSISCLCVYCRFVPDLEDIVSFEELVTGTCPGESVEAAR